MGARQYQIVKAACNLGHTTVYRCNKVGYSPLTHQAAKRYIQSYEVCKDCGGDLTKFLVGNNSDLMGPFLTVNGII